MNTIFSLTTRDPYSSRERYSARKLLGYAAIIGLALFGVRAQAETKTIQFEGLPVSAVESYSELGMRFIPAGDGYSSFRTNASGYIGPHRYTFAPIRMIYDPNGDGVPDGRFNLLGLDVVRPEGEPGGAGFKVHAEVDYSGVNGGVYGPWGEGSWELVGPHNTGLLFVDFAPCDPSECGKYDVDGLDNIVVEPLPGPVPTANCNGIRATIVGTSGNDTISGTALPDVIQGLGGHDTIAGYIGNDRICGGGGNDAISGGFGADKLNGGTGSDYCDGGYDSDTATACETKVNIP